MPTPTRKPPTDDALLHDLHEALLAHPQADGFHVSIEPHSREVKEGKGPAFFAKAVCWNLTRGGEEIEGLAPELLLVDEDRNDDTLRAECEALFPGYAILVDNEIWIDDEPA